MKEIFNLKKLKSPSQIFTCLLENVSPTVITPVRSFSTITSKNNNNKYYSNPENLTREQEDILEVIRKGRSVFITGSAGTGKSFLVKKAINLLKQMYRPSQVFITASTGVAALNLNGQTLHSFAGIGLGEGLDRKKLLDQVLHNKPALWKWQRVKALVIDEVSMIKPGFLDNLEYIAAKLRSGDDMDEPWGGIQLIVSGDFFQLAPVKCEEFAFEAECWDFSFYLQVELTKVFRQSDPQFIDLLQGIRRGVKDEHHLKQLQQCYIKQPMETYANVPHLYPKCLDVERVNRERLSSLRGKVEKYKADDSSYDKDRGCSEFWKSKLNNGIAPEVLELCRGARVMLIKNKDVKNGLMNGAMGTVVGFTKTKKRSKGISDTGRVPVVEFDSGPKGYQTIIEPEKWEVMEGDVKLATRKQIPLILAWAVSIHKCQGLTLDCFVADLSNAFGKGMVYTALSRAKSVEGIHLSGPFDPKKIEADPKVLKYYYNQFGN